MLRATPRNAATSPALAALPLVAVMVGNVALALGPWFVRMADVGPVAAAFWRLTLAAPLLLAIVMMVDGNPLRHARGLGWVVAIAGVVFAADLASWHTGILNTTLANATLFGNSAVLMFPLWGFLIARAWPTGQQGSALALAAVGGALLLGRSYQLSPQNLVGDLLCLLAGTFYTAYLILMARARGRMSALAVLSLSSLAGAVPLLLIALALGERVWPTDWSAVLALALVCQVFGQWLMMYAIAHLPPVVMGVALLLQPVFSGMIGWVIYDERLGFYDFVGAALIAAALVLVSIRPSPVAPPADGLKS